MDRFVGTGVALITPFDENLNIDKESLGRLVTHVIEGGVDFLVALGTTAETATLNAVERTEVVNIIADVNNGRLPLMVGIGGNDTNEVIREIQEAEYLKRCQGILSVTPYYNKPSQEGMYQHFKAIAELSPLPICLYNVPSRTGVSISAETVVRLEQEFLNIIALKEASGNFEQATDILKLKDSNFIALSGDDVITLPLMAMGFDGVISVAANVLPQKCSNLVNSIAKGDFSTAQKLHIDLSDLCKLLFEEGNPAGIKAALHAAGVIKHNTLRLPLVPVGEDLYRRLEVAIS